jgi:hypothetical protein
MPFYIYNKDKSVKIRCKSSSDPKAQQFLGWDSNQISRRLRDKTHSIWFLIDGKGPYYLEADNETAQRRAKRLGRDFKADYTKAKEKMEPEPEPSSVETKPSGTKPRLKAVINQVQSLEAELLKLKEELRDRVPNPQTPYSIPCEYDGILYL